MVFQKQQAKTKYNKARNMGVKRCVYCFLKIHILRWKRRRFDELVAPGTGSCRMEISLFWSNYYRHFYDNLVTGCTGSSGTNNDENIVKMMIFPLSVWIWLYLGWLHTKLFRTLPFIAPNWQLISTKPVLSFVTCWHPLCCWQVDVFKFAVN